MRHEVRHDLVLGAGKERAGAAEAGDHLVGDEEDVEVAAELAHRLHPASGRHEHAARPLDRFGIEGGNALGGPISSTLLFQCRNARQR